MAAAARRGSAVAWMLLSTLLFAGMTALVKATPTVSIPEVILFRNLPSVIALFLYARARALPIGTPHVRLYVLRCVIGFTGMAAGFYAIRHLPLATASTLDYTAPLFLVAATVARHGRSSRTVEIASVGIGFAGVLLLLQPSLDASQTPGFVAGMLGGACAAVAYVCLRRLGEVGEPGWRIVFVYACAGVLGSALMLPFSAPSVYTPGAILSLASIGLVGLGAQLSMTHAFRLGHTTMLATVQYTTVIFSVCLGVLFWGELPNAAGVAGLALIVLSAVLAARSMAAKGALGEEHGQRMSQITKGKDSDPGD